jgi:hypothetical protein
MAVQSQTNKPNGRYWEMYVHVNDSGSKEPQNRRSFWFRRGYVGRTWGRQFFRKFPPRSRDVVEESV